MTRGRAGPGVLLAAAGALGAASAWLAVGSAGAAVQVARADGPAFPAAESVSMRAPATAAARAEGVAARAAAGGEGLRLVVVPSAGTPMAGRARLLHRPAFAPVVRFDAELWQVFSSGPLGDVDEVAGRVFDRLARLGYESVAEAAWVAPEPAVFAVGAPAQLAVAFSGWSVGFVGLDGGRDARVVTWGAGEVAATGAGDLWTWSGSPFPGPHRAGCGHLVPAAPSRVLEVAGGERPALRYFLPLEIPPRGIGAPVLVPTARDRTLRAAEGAVGCAIVHVDGPDTEPSRDAAAVPVGCTGPDGALCVTETGEPFGALVVRPRSRPTPAR